MRGDLSIPRRERMVWVERMEPSAERRRQRKRLRVLLAFLFVVYLTAAAMAYLHGGRAIVKTQTGNRVAAEVRAEDQLPF